VNPDAERLSGRMEHLAVRSDELDRSTSTEPNEPDEPEHLVQQRTDMAQRIAADARARRIDPTPSELEIFAAAGMEDKLANRGEVNVVTEWLPPVVQVRPPITSLPRSDGQETIIVKEHVEVTEVIQRDIHIHHILYVPLRIPYYAAPPLKRSPKIQPIFDPDPIILERRHRICDGSTGKWHEVVGDDAAIAILGLEVFERGPREEREERAPALEPLPWQVKARESTSALGGGGEGDDVAGERKYEHRVIERVGKGGVMDKWRTLAGGRGGEGAGEGMAEGDKEGTEHGERMIGEVDLSKGRRTMDLVI
jgi:hypothetical protein